MRLELPVGLAIRLGAEVGVVEVLGRPFNVA